MILDCTGTRIVLLTLLDTHCSLTKWTAKGICRDATVTIFSTVVQRDAATAEFSTFPKAGEIAILRHGR